MISIAYTMGFVDVPTLNFLTVLADTSDMSKSQKLDILAEVLGGRVVGGTLSQLANYADLFQRMHEGVLLLDRHSYRVLEANPAALKILGVPETDLVGAVFSQADWVQKLGTGVEAQLDWQNQKILQVSRTQLKILDYIEVIQLMIRDVTAEKLAQRDLEEANTILQRLSTTDEMTGLKNYRTFKELLLKTHQQAAMQNSPYGVIFIDVDHFKKFNDRNGHPAGDQVLKLVAQILKSKVGSQDLPARYGGEEFVVLCRTSTAEQTQRLAETIRQAIEAKVFPFGEFQPLGRVTVSVGVAAFPEAGASPDEVLNHADAALYVSKHQGRNQVTLYQPGMVKAAS